MAPKKKSSSGGSNTAPDQVHKVELTLQNLWRNYMTETPSHLKAIDAFMIFCIYLGLLQFVYCLIVGTYPFNAFLAGFGSTVGQFVLTAGLRIQSNVQNDGEFKHSRER